MVPEKDSLFFMHIPKTAGTTLNDILKRKYQNKNILIDYGRRDISETVQKISTLPEDRKSQVKLLIAHVGFGLHNCFTHQNFNYITLLRDPVERLVSEYYFIRRKKDHPLHREIIKSGVNLETFVDGEILGQKHSDNCQVRFLSGEYGIPYEKRITDELASAILQTAKQNLKSFSVIGTLDKFDETLLLIKEFIGLKDVSYIAKNTSGNQNKGYDLSDRILKKIITRNELDIELYKYVSHILENQINDRGNEFSAELKQLRSENSLKQNNALKKAINIWPSKCISKINTYFSPLIEIDK